MPEPQFDLGRVPIPLEPRANASTLAAGASRLAAMLGRGWTTAAALGAAEEAALQQAKDALALHTSIVAIRKAAEAEAQS